MDRYTPGHSFAYEVTGFTNQCNLNWKMATTDFDNFRGSTIRHDLLVPEQAYPANSLNTEHNIFVRNFIRYQKYARGWANGWVVHQAVVRNAARRELGPDCCRSETNRAYRPRLPTRGRRRAANTSARLRTTTLPAQAFARYTATFRPTPVADGKTTLSIPSEIQMAANSCETEYPGPRRQTSTTFASSDGSVAAGSRFRLVATERT